MSRLHRARPAARRLVPALVAGGAALAVIPGALLAQAGSAPAPLSTLGAGLPAALASPTLPVPVPTLPVGPPAPGSATCPTPRLNPISADPSTSGVQTVAASGAPTPQGPQSGPAGTWVQLNGTNLVAPGCWTYVFVGAAQQALPTPTAGGAVPPQPSATSITVAAGGSAAAPQSGPVSVVLSPGGPPTGGVAQPAPTLPGGVVPTGPAPGSVTSNANLTFVEPPAVTQQQSEAPEGSRISFSGAGFSLGGLAGKASAPLLAYLDGTDPASPPCSLAAADPVSSDTALAGYTASTFCSGAMLVQLHAPRDTADPAAGESTAWAVAGTADVTPVVIGVEPRRAVRGEAVVVYGSGFGTSGTATAGGAAAQVAQWQDRDVVLVVPQAAADGSVALVRGADGRSIATGGFQLVPSLVALPGIGSVFGGLPGTRVPAGIVPAKLSGPVGQAPPPPAPPQPKPAAKPEPLAFLGSLSLPDVLRSPLFGALGLLAVLVAAALVVWRRRTLAAAAGGGAATPAVERRSPFSGPVWRFMAAVVLRIWAEIWRQQSVRTGWARLKPRLMRALSVISGALMVNVYLIAAVSTLTALAVYVGLSASTPGPEGGLYLVAGVFVSFALTGIAIRYIYYYRCWAVSRHWFKKPAPVDVAALRARGVPYMKVQVTTKGGALPVVQRSLDELCGILERQEWLQPLLSAEVITEVEEEARTLEEHFAGSVLQVTGVTLPADYRTPNGTRLKARALHYMCELRRGGFLRRPGRTFIVHFDEETLCDEANLLVLADYLSRDPRPVSQGPILYPLEWHRTPWICRALESTRPFGCSECARVMENPPPPHLHGSNLVVDEAVENRLGWDFGTVDGQPYVAEDLLFGLRAYAALGENAFGWHGATMLEQPPFSLYWAVQQRLRWVLGALQGLRAMSTDEEYAAVPREQKRRLFWAISFRIATYAMGFPVGFAGLYFVLHPAQVATEWQSAFGLWHVLIIVSGVSWFLSYQIGIARNLRYQDLPRRQHVLHAVVMILLTPIAGLCETVGPFLAVIRWMFGLRRASWTPTPKLDQPRLRPGTPA